MYKKIKINNKELLFKKYINQYIARTSWYYQKNVSISLSFSSGVTIMLSLTIFASLVGEMLPVSDGSPLIG